MNIPGVYLIYACAGMCVCMCICIYAVAIPSKRINELKRFKSDRQFVRHLSFTFYSSLFNRYRLYSLMVTKKKRNIDLRVGVLYRPNKSVTNATKLKCRLFAVNIQYTAAAISWRYMNGIVRAKCHLYDLLNEMRNFWRTEKIYRLFSFI